jgi:hypothetical protein
MSAKPELIRPFPQRYTPTSARGAALTDVSSIRNRFASLQNSGESFQPDDILNLKREKQNLIQERHLLKAKLARYANFNHHPKLLGHNQQIANTLEHQVRTLEQVTAAKRAEVAQLIHSDRSAVITELQEESKVLHLELMRLKKEKREIEHSFRDVSVELKEASQTYSPEALVHHNKTVKSLEKEIEEQSARNDQIKEKVAQIKDERRSTQNQNPNGKVARRIESIKSQIKQEKNEIADLDQQLAQMKLNHAAHMQRLQSKL